jgi:hypothetical protein
LGKELFPAQFVKDLGVTFDRNLNFSEHILKIGRLLRPDIVHFH